MNRYWSRPAGKSDAVRVIGCSGRLEARSRQARSSWLRDQNAFRGRRHFGRSLGPEGSELFRRPTFKGMKNRNTPKRWATRSLWARPRLGTALADRAAYRFEAEVCEQLVHRVSATSLARDPCYAPPCSQR